MPSWLSGLLQTMGLATPAVYAAAIVQSFQWIDRSASDEARKALSDWLRSKGYDAAAIGCATIEMFDRIYTNRLLSWRAFARSALISICVGVILLFETYSGKQTEDLYGLLHPDNALAFRNELETFGDAFVVNILTDYLSLFAVRRLLVVAQARPLFALWIGPLVGILIVVLLNFLLGDFLEAISLYTRGVLPPSVTFWDTVVGMLKLTLLTPEWRVMSIAAFVVHMWLPLFALVAGLAGALGWLQWFLKDGLQRPYEIIGYLMGGVVMVGGFLVKFVRAE
jgi:hypothetical protein